MQKIIVIGTLHLGLTPRNELKKILEELSPTQLFVELSEGTKITPLFHHNSDEMVFAAQWADTKGIPVTCFDAANESILQEGLDSENTEYKKLINAQVSELKAFSWKDLNNETLWKTGKLCEIQRELYTKYIDPTKWRVREEMMLKNIRKNIQTDGIIVILTGVGHLDFFENNLPEVELLFRK